MIHKRKSHGCYAGVSCKYEGCDRPARARDYCATHYRKAIDNNLIEIESKCSIEDCNRNVYAKGMCRKHYAYNSRPVKFRCYRPEEDKILKQNLSLESLLNLLPDRTENSIRTRLDRLGLRKRYEGSYIFSYMDYFSDRIINEFNNYITKDYLRKLIELNKLSYSDLDLIIYYVLNTVASDKKACEMVLKRYGYKQKTHTLQSVADIYNLTRERIRQVCNKNIENIESIINVVLKKKMYNPDEVKIWLDEAMSMKQVADFFDASIETIRHRNLPKYIDSIIIKNNICFFERDIVRLDIRKWDRERKLVINGIK